MKAVTALKTVLLVCAGALTGVVGPAGATAAQATAAEEPAQDQAPSLEAFAGSYVYAGGDAQREALRAEIDAATEDLNVALRAIARRKIWKSQDPSRMMTISVEGDHVSIVRSGGKAAFTGTVGHGSFSVDGKYRGRLYWKNGTLLVDITGGDQHTQVRLTMNPDGRTVTVRTSIEHDMLPRTIRLKKTFRAVG